MSKTKENILAVIGAAADKTGAARERKKAKANPTAFAAVWNDQLASTYSDVDVAKAGGMVAPTLKNLSLLKRAMKRLPNQDQKHQKDFLEWTIRTWDTSMGLIFGNKGRSGPTYPQLNFFVSTIDRWYSAYCRRGVSEVSSDNSQKTIEQLEAQVQKLERTVKVLRGELDASKNSEKALKAQIATLRKPRKGTLSKWE